MKFELDRLPKNSSIEDIKKEVLRVSNLIHNKIITKREFDKLSKISSSTLLRKFGNWKSILEKFGLTDRYSGKIVTDKMRNQTKHLSNDEIIEEIRRVAKDLNTNHLTIGIINRNSNIISDSTIRKRFGSWYNGLKKANLTELIKGNKYSELDYFENLLNVWKYYSRQPKYREMNIYPSTITSGAYESKWGSWSNSLNAFIEFVNRDVKQNQEEDDDDKEKVKEKKQHKESRTVPLSLRYKVLSRDRFKCVKCGRSPSTDIDCELQVDHIIPFSKGGKTVLENLQTTCKKCNLGKSNKFNE